jgi:hypothetical protein
VLSSALHMVSILVEGRSMNESKRKQDKKGQKKKKQKKIAGSFPICLAFFFSSVRLRMTR